MYFLLHTFSLTPKSTPYIASQDRKMVKITHLQYQKEHPRSSILPLIWQTH